MWTPEYCCRQQRNSEAGLAVGENDTLLSTNARASKMFLYWGQVHIGFGKISGMVPTGVRDPLQDGARPQHSTKEENPFRCINAANKLIHWSLVALKLGVRGRDQEVQAPHGTESGQLRIMEISPSSPYHSRERRD